MSANLLHTSRLEAFKLWLTKNDRGWRPGKGPYQVIQVLTENSGWQVVFRRNTMPEHFSINTALEPLVRRFIRESRLEEEVAAKAIDWHEQEIQVCEMLDAQKLAHNLQLSGLPVLTDIPPWEEAKVAAPHHSNPWNLSPQQERTVHLYSLEGTYKGVAARMGLTYATVNSNMRDSRLKMGTRTITRCAVLYALWRREVLGPSSEIEALLNPITNQKESP